MPVYRDTPTKDGREWCFRIKYKNLFGVDKFYKSKRYKLKKEAEDAEFLFKKKKKKNDTSRISITFKNIFDEYMLKHTKEIKPQTVVKINNQFKQLSFIHDTKINEFDLAKYNLIRREIEKKNFSVGYSNKLLGLIKTLITYSNKYHNTNDRILKFFETFKSINEFEKEMKFFTYKEYQQFNSVIDDPEYQVFFSVLYFMGLRQGEAQALTWNDINFTRNELSIKKKKVQDETSNVDKRFLKYQLFLQGSGNNII